MRNGVLGLGAVLLVGGCATGEAEPAPTVTVTATATPDAPDQDVQERLEACERAVKAADAMHKINTRAWDIVASASDALVERDAAALSAANDEISQNREELLVHLAFYTGAAETCTQD